MEEFQIEWTQFMYTIWRVENNEWNRRLEFKDEKKQFWQEYSYLHDLFLLKKYKFIFEICASIEWENTNKTNIRIWNDILF